MARGSQISPETNKRGLEMLRAGKRPSEIAQALGVGATTIRRWQLESGVWFRGK